MSFPSFNTIVTLLKSDNALNTLAFASGFVASIPKERFIIAPLGSLLFGAIPGGITMIGANMVASLLPHSMRPLIPLGLGLNICYHAVTGPYVPPPQKID